MTTTNGIDTSNVAPVKLKKSDFESDQDVRWCPGCGDYSILATVQRYLPNEGKDLHNYVFVSGIGCSSRFPYYMNTYGFHTIHGRAPAFATGIKSANPELSVWMVTGDGDALSIGGNHIIHLLRRNPDINVLLFNNQIYGLTKGQYSPTSEVGKVTKSSPHGSVDAPLQPLALALGANSTFVARSLDVDVKHLSAMLEAGSKHKGTAFIEIYQNCNIFNDGAFDSVRERDARAQRQLILEDGKPLVYGKDPICGLRIADSKVEIIKLSSDDADEAIKAGVTVYDSSNRVLANALATLPATAEYPIPMGIFYQTQRETFETTVCNMNDKHKATRGDSSVDEVLSDLFNAGNTWAVS